MLSKTKAAAESAAGLPTGAASPSDEATITSTSYNKHQDVFKNERAMALEDDKNYSKRFNKSFGWVRFHHELGETTSTPTMQIHKWDMLAAVRIHTENYSVTT